MPLQTLLINGPSGSGKSTAARLIKDQVLDRPAHYLRLVPAQDTHTNAVLAYEPHDSDALGSDWSSMHAVNYTVDRVFETIPEGLRAVRRLDRTAFIVIEADEDPAIRHAYPYDYRIFMMSAPSDIFLVFRTPDMAAAALHQVLQDTAAFASEIFGLFDDDLLDDSEGVQHYAARPLGPGGQRVEQLHVSESQIRQFLSSPLGAEIASRIQLQPAYHALVEADIVLINTAFVARRDKLDECIDRLQKLLSRIRQDARRQSVLFWGDILDDQNLARRKLLARLRTLLVNDV